MKREGWWGFEEMKEGEEKMKRKDGRIEKVEVGGMIWVKEKEMK